MDKTLSAFERAIKDEGIKPYLTKLLSLALVYIVAARLGLSLAFSFDQITMIWPASGVAITALLLWGYHYWPGVFVGAFMINSLMGVSPAVSTGIAFGNTLEAIVAIFLIHRFVPHGKILETITGTVNFVVLAPFLSSIIAATIGVSSLLFGDIITASQVGQAWLVWWSGDLVGSFLLVPFIVAWSTKEYREEVAGHVYEALALLLIVSMVSLLIFTQEPQSTGTVLPFVYILFPLIILAAVRFRQIGAVTGGMVIAIASIWGTLVEKGPYVYGEVPEHNLFALHFFLLIIMVTALVLSVAVYGRIRSEDAMIKQAIELNQAKQQVIQHMEQRKDLQAQMNEATTKINEILTSIFDEKANRKSSRPRTDR